MTIAKRHAQAVADFKALEKIAPLDDQINFADEVNDLMFDPTKKRALSMIEGGIDCWFREHGHSAETDEIANRYNLHRP